MTPYVTLLRPEWLLLLPLLAGLGWWLHRQRGQLGGWERAANPALLQALAALGRVSHSRGGTGLFAALGAAAIGILALSGPAQERRDAVSFRNLDGAVFVIDASPSVTGSDRWSQLQTMGRFGVSALGTRPGGLVVYAGDAYVASDLTRDLRQLGQTVSVIDAETVPDKGSRPGRGLALATQMLEDGQVLAGDVVLFTDGAGLGPDTLAEAQAIAARGARLSVVTLNAPSAETETLSRVGNGRTFTLDQTDAFARFLSEDARTRLEAQDFPLLFQRDFGRYLLALALLPLLLLFRRRAT
ncbi:vWA domain-containing protein [Sagittula stellata]|uniref:VWFA domain-containing protein n=1 Tax=Sagittula stellata (strain ATCC 700073 / DSM 11524 / E-37) TaxID=388399 RepID=A3K7J2_SAGS3|nr:vWA domain-containing protein [Sagittula stellata]EBA06951.1 hypothetical protein SSE37_00730 [Sagittula stellata E-37]